MSTPISPADDIRYMKMALDEAARAYDNEEVPVGAIIVCKGRVIARAHNLTETLTDVTAHAEMQAVTAAANSHTGIPGRIYVSGGTVCDYRIMPFQKHDAV